MSTETKPPEPQAPLPAGQYGQFLSEHGINSERLPDSLGAETIVLAKQDLDSAIKLLRNSSEINLDLLITISGVDMADSIDAVYHLWSYSHKGELVIKVRALKTEIPQDQLPTVHSIARFWPSANWHERETYDLVGIRFTGHPYMRRILNPWDWDGHPLRRDYKQPVDCLNDKNPHSFR